MLSTKKLIKISIISVVVAGLFTFFGGYLTTTEKISSLIHPSPKYTETYVDEPSICQSLYGCLEKPDTIQVDCTSTDCAALHRYDVGWPVGFSNKDDGGLAFLYVLIDFLIFYPISFALILLISKYKKAVPATQVIASTARSVSTPSDVAWNKTMLFVIVGLLTAPALAAGLLYVAVIVKIGIGVTELLLMAVGLGIFLVLLLVEYRLFKSIKLANPILARRALIFVAIPSVLTLSFAAIIIMVASTSGEGLVLAGGYFLGIGLATILYTLVTLLALLFCAIHYMKKYKAQS